MVRISASVLMKFRLKSSTRMIEKVASSVVGIDMQHDHRHARAVQEQQQHDRGEHDRRQQLFEHAVDRGADEGAVVLDDDDLGAAGQRRLDLWDQPVDAVGDVGRVGAGLGAQAEQHARVAVDTGQLGLLDAGQLNGRHVAEPHRRVRRAADDDLAEVLRLGSQAVDAQVVRVRVLRPGCRLARPCCCSRVPSAPSVSDSPKPVSLFGSTWTWTSCCWPPTIPTCDTPVTCWNAGESVSLATL